MKHPSEDEDAIRRALEALRLLADGTNVLLSPAQDLLALCNRAAEATTRLVALEPLDELATNLSRFAAALDAPGVPLSPNEDASRQIAHQAIFALLRGDEPLDPYLKWIWPLVITRTPLRAEVGKR